MNAADLQEELAVRLQQISFATRPTKDGLLQADVATALADECLRQMEWARHEHGWSTCPVCGGPPHPGLTLAPPEWKP